MMRKLESVHKNETYKILWDSDIQTSNLISARRQHRVLINETYSEFCCSGWSQIKNKKQVEKVKNT